MVDPNKFKDKVEEAKDKKKNKSKKAKEKDNGSSGRKGPKRKKDIGDSSKDDRPETYNAFKEDESFPAEDQEFIQGAEQVPGSDGEDAKKGANGSLETYRDRQEREMREMYSSLLGDIKQLNEGLSGEEDLGSLESFTLSLQAAVYNMAQQRAGVAEILMERFGKSEDEAVAIAGQIAKNSGEGQSMEDIIGYLAENLVK